MKTDRILSLDPSSAATGWCFYEDGVITSSGFEVFLIDKEAREGERLNRVRDWLKNMICLFEPDLVILESYFFRGKFASGSDLNPEIRGAMKMACADLDVDHTMMIPSHWKKVVAGRMSPTKSEKRKYGKEKAKKVFIVDSLEKTYGIECPKKIRNPKTNKMINFKYDITDAIGILVCFLIENNLPIEFGGTIFEFDI
jgi:Holliday junction resolvasome RuvABC endonuclease subunit